MKPLSSNYRIIRTIKETIAFNNKGEVVDVPTGTFIAHKEEQANLLINLGLAEPVESYRAIPTYASSYDNHQAIH